VRGPGSDGLLDGVLDVALGPCSACALPGAGNVWCWGAEVQGPLGNGTSVTTSAVRTPAKVLAPSGSGALDRSGNIAIGYSVSSRTLHPAIHFTGRLAGDAIGVMTQGDNTIINGAGSQSSGLSRWGSYSAMTVDPSDDCTFFYTNEYIPSNGGFNWRTRVGSFKFPAARRSAPRKFKSVRVGQGFGKMT
jgi:hypothetical protein